MCKKMKDYIIFINIIDLLSTIMDAGFAVPQINYGQKYTSCPGSFYARDEMQRLLTENAQLKDTLYKMTGRRWGDDLGPGKYSDDGKSFKPLDKNEHKVGQLQVCINVMANVIAEYLTHLKKCAMPYMEAYYRNDLEEIKKHHQAFMPNHVKSIITFQKYVQAVINDAERDPEEFEKMLFEQSQEELIHAELANSYDIHYNIIPDMQKKSGMSTKDAAAYAINEIAKEHHKVTFKNIKVNPVNLPSPNIIVIPVPHVGNDDSPLEQLD